MGLDQFSSRHPLFEVNGIASQKLATNPKGNRIMIVSLEFLSVMTLCEPAQKVSLPYRERGPPEDIAQKSTFSLSVIFLLFSRLELDSRWRATRGRSTS
jgi:hypothetical protein